MASSNRLTLAQRAAAYAGAYPEHAAAHLQVVAEQGAPVLYGRWLIGQNYRAKSAFYGAYPPGLLARVRALFPDVDDRDVLHVFSGSLPPGAYTRCDVHPARGAELVCRAEDLPARAGGRRWLLVVADPPYSADDAARYETPMVDRGTVTAALARVTRPGGYLAWLDVCWPMHRKELWRTVGRIAVTRSTNHRLRDLTIFERRGR